MIVFQYVFCNILFYFPSTLNEYISVEDSPCQGYVKRKESGFSFQNFLDNHPIPNTQTNRNFQNSVRLAVSFSKALG